MSEPAPANDCEPLDDATDRIERGLDILRRRVIALGDSIELLTLEVRRLRGEGAERHNDMATVFSNLPELIRRSAVWHAGKQIKNLSSHVARLVVRGIRDDRAEVTEDITDTFYPPFDEKTPVDK